MMTRHGRIRKHGQEEPDGGACSSDPGPKVEAKAEEKLEELAGLVKSLIRSQAVSAQQKEKESSCHEQRWKRMQNKFSQTKVIRNEHRPEHDTLEEGQHPQRTDCDDDD